MFEIMANIHFLRPWWFLALLPIIWIIWQAWQVNQKQGAWHQVIEPKFRRLLLGENATSEPSLNEKLGYIGLAFAWFFTVLALSGPWIKSVDVPAQKSQQGVVIVLDLSLSMLADDVSPDRIARVKYTLTDLLKQNPEYAIGMVVYAGSAHTISPISEDNKTLLGLLPSLNPVVMPQFGSDPLLGLQKADDLLTGAKITQGHIIWISDDIEANQIGSIEDWIDSKPYSISLLTVGSKKGGVVQIPGYGLLKDDDGKLIMPEVPLQRFADLADETGIEWQHLRIGVDNSQNLLPPKLTSSDLDSAQTEKEVNHPLDIGFYFLFLLIPLAAFLFRRGTLLNLAALALLPGLLLNPQPSYAGSLLSDLGEVFKSHDQQGYQAWEAEEYDKAEALFENKQWRASALYRQGRYAEAAKLFALDKSAVGYYNQGNALTKSMQLDEAIKAYEQALLINPSMQAAKENLAIAQKLKTISSATQLPEQSENGQNGASEATENSRQESSQQTQKNDQQTTQPQQTDNSTGSGGEQGAENEASKQSGDDVNSDSGNAQNATQDGQQAQDATPSNQGQATDNQDAQTSEQNASQRSGVAEADGSGDEAQNAAETADGQANKLADTQSTKSDNTKDAKPALSEEEQAQQNWLKQIPDQPGVFLKRKFEYQYQQNPRTDNENKKQW